MSKLDDLLEIEGLTIEELYEELMNGMTCPGICMNEGCNFTRNIEPDNNTGYCEECETNTVKSSENLILGL